MPVQEVRYYFIECDDCGRRHPHEDDDLDDLLAAATEDHWMVNRDGQYPVIFCPSCFERQLGA